MANHKRRRPKPRRAGCLLCKMHKHPAHRTAQRRRDRDRWRKAEGLA